MKIQETVYKKKKGYIVANGERFDNLSLSVMLKYSFKPGDQIDANEFDKFLKESEAVVAKEYLFSLLARGARTENEARKKLYDKDFSKASVAAAIALAKGYGYLSDIDYTKNYIETHSKTKGKYRLKRELINKGIASDLAESMLNDTEIDEKSAALETARKFVRNRTMDEKTQQRLFRHLASRGFSYDIVKHTLSIIGIYIDED